MHYTLMHKEISVVDIELDDASGAITRVGDVHNAAHIPIGIAYRNDVLDRKALNKLVVWALYSGKPSRYPTSARYSAYRQHARAYR